MAPLQRIAWRKTTCHALLAFDLLRPRGGGKDQPSAIVGTLASTSVNSLRNLQLDIVDELNFAVRIYIYLELLLKKVRENNYVFFPINHFKGMHYTLLVFNKQSGWWEHYNTLQTKLNMYVDPYFEEAKKLHVKISDYFKHMKDSILRKLNENSICKHIMKGDKV
ncbi:hypothetical protein C1H46_029647 [Malus baccata]|uniref:Uncharacterized protein n=1 Tax=Malus baccata TaxID=106549 RepID=A0A540LEN9_MALBA|nr:hypothetical protein C1H46_029647 [Malus baccata]